MSATKRVGFFRNLQHGSPSEQTLLDRSRESALPDRDRVASYLESAKTLAAAAGFTRDVIDPNHPIIGPLTIKTDGVWEWPSDYTYYLLRYNAPLPDDFLQHIRSTNYLPAITDAAK
jgi:hypothetical protein